MDQHRKWRNSTDCWDRREVHVLGQQPCGNTRPGRNQNGGYHSNISCSCSYSRSPRDWVDVRQGLYSCDLSNKSIKRLIFISANPRTIPGEGRVECLLYLNVNLISLRVIRALAPVKVRACLILKLTTFFLEILIECGRGYLDAFLLQTSVKSYRSRYNFGTRSRPIWRENWSCLECHEWNPPDVYHLRLFLVRGYSPMFWYCSHLARSVSDIFEFCYGFTCE